MKRVIHYKLTEQSNFIYHILSSFNFKKEWGPANLYNHEYIENNHYKVKTNLKITNIIKKIYGPLSFWSLNIKYNSVEQMLKDLVETNEINHLLKFFNEKPLSLNEKKVLYTFFSNEYKNNYKNLWSKRFNNYNKLLNLFNNQHIDVVESYLNFLDKINPSIKFPKNVIIYLIEPLGKKGRGLIFGCAIGLPHNKSELNRNLLLGLHEMTHPYSDKLLESLGYDINVKPTDKINHSRKEITADYILDKYISKYPKTFGIKSKIKTNNKLVPEKIKITLESIKL